MFESRSGRQFHDLGKFRYALVNRILKATGAIALMCALVFAGFRVEDRIGLEPLPAETPVSRGVDNPHYREAIDRASAIITAHRNDIASPAYSAAVAVGGEIVWTEAIGWADIENRVPATPETMFRIGSTSKSLTASATARLVEKGVVDLDKPISSYMLDLPEHWRPLTLRQLHSHTAGIPGYGENADLRGIYDSYFLQRHFEDVNDTLDAFDGTKLLFEPGTSFHYSSFDVNLASAILQAAAAIPFLEILQNEVFDPAGMENTAADDVSRSIANRAVSYKRRGRLVEPWKDVDLSLKYASGGLLSTSSDLVKLGLAYLGGDYLAEETITEFWTPQVLASGELNEQSYAIGWRSTHAFHEDFGEDVWYVHHGGVSKGAMSWFVVFPKMELVIALNANTRAETFGEFAKPSREIAKLFYEARLRMPVNTSSNRYSDTRPAPRLTNIG